MANKKPIKIFLSVWSPFYSPVFLTEEFLSKEKLSATYDVLKGAERLERIKGNKANTVVAAAVSLHWESNNIEKRKGIYHFAQINCRDGFFLVGREPCENFHWNHLNSKNVLFSGRQPVTALKYALKKNDASAKPIYDKMGSIKEMLQAFCKGKGDFIHLQGYWAQQLVDENPKWCIVKVGVKPVPEYSFSSLMASKDFIKGNQFERFMKAYGKALNYAATRDPQEIADKLKCFFFPMAKDTPVVLTNCIKQYQELGCWRHDGQITKEHYEKVKEIFLEIKGVSGLPYDEVVRQPA